MKVLFINPRYNEYEYRYKVNKLCPPLGMAYMASILLEEGHTVKILDMEAIEMEWDALPTYLDSECPDLVGIHATTPVSCYVAQCASIVRAALSDSTIVVGGPHATLLPEEVLTNMPEVDYVLRGEAEYTMLNLVRQLEDRGAVTNTDEIPGIGYRRGDRTFVSTEVPRIEDLDSLPLPAHHLLPSDAYFEAGTAGRVSTMMSSRGCPYSCIFCNAPALYGNKFRARSAQNVADEMSVLTGDYGIDHIIFYDASFAIDRKRVERICQEIKDRSLDVSWRIRARADRVTEPMLTQMKEAGCTSVSLGVETASQRLLDVLNKRCRKRDIENAFRMANELGLWTVAYFMFGIPGETPQDSYETIEFAKQLDPDWALFSIATPMPGTKLLDLVQDSLTTTDWSKFKFTANCPVVSYNGMSARELKKIVDHAYRSFYLREDWLVNRLKKVSSVEETAKIVSSFFFYLNKVRYV